MTPAAAAETEPVTSLKDLRHAVESRRHHVGAVNLEAEVCAADAVRGLLTLKDATGVEVCDLDLGRKAFHPGQRIRISAAPCELIRREWSVALTTSPVVDNAGIGSRSETSGRTTLTAGLHPLKLFYFKGRHPAPLRVTYAGPGVPGQKIPATALFMEHPRPARQNSAPRRGLKFFCYDEIPATPDGVRNQTPIHSGEAADFDIALRQPEEHVAVYFEGFIEIPESGEYVFSAESDDPTVLYIGTLKPRTVLISSNSPPIARPLALSQSVPPPSSTCEWGTLEGQVKFIGTSSEGLEMELKEANHSTRLWLPSHDGINASLLLDARVRATGAYRGVLVPEGQTRPGMISVVSAADLRVLSIAPEQWDKHPVTSISNLMGTAHGPDALIAHLRGTLTNLGPDGAILLDDGTGQIGVRLGTPDGLTNGMAVDVLAPVTRSESGMHLGLGFYRGIESALSVWPTLTTAAQVQQLSAREAARQHSVWVRGVITCLVDWGGAVVQDSTRGVFFNFEPFYRDGLVPGDFVEIQGVTAVGDFAPVISARSIRILGVGRIPDPVRPNWNQLMRGSLDCQFAEVRGVVTDAGRNHVTLLTEGGKIGVKVYDRSEAELKRLVNTLILIRGCLLAQWDTQTRQVRVGEITIRNPTIQIDPMAGADLFAAPEKTLTDLLMFDPHAAGLEHVKMFGQVVHVRTGELFLMQDGMGFRLRPAEDTGLKVGDVAEVVGIPELGGASPRLHEAVALKIGTAPLPKAIPWTEIEDSGRNPEAILMRTEARLIDIHRTGPEWVMELQTGLRTFRARVEASEHLAGEFPLGSRLEVLGVYATLTGSRNADPSGFELLLNSPADIHLVQRPPWWNLQRLLYIVASLIAFLAAAAVWISQLRRQVVQRTRSLEREHARREHAERERALEIERSRIARDLHDDLGASLTEIRVLASTGLRLKQPQTRAPTLFHSITEKACNLITALDVIVWAVDPKANSLQSLADYLSGYAAEYLANSNLLCRFKIPVPLPVAILDGQVRHELFLAVKETLHNAVRHSRATEVEFHLDVIENAIEISIVDNGCGFAVSDATADGHGLRNIPERLARLGGECRMESRPGAGTRVTIHLPLPQPEAEMDGYSSL